MDIPKFLWEMRAFSLRNPQIIGLKRSELLGFALIFVSVFIVVITNFSLLFGLPIETFELAREISLTVFAALFSLGTTCIAYEEHKVRILSFMLCVFSLLLLVFVITRHALLESWWIYVIVLPHMLILILSAYFRVASIAKLLRQENALRGTVHSIETIDLPK